MKPRDVPQPWFADVAPGPAPSPVDQQDQFPLLGSVRQMPEIRARLHTICALYAHSPSATHRSALLDNLEYLALQAAQILAVELLECGWRPDADPEPIRRGEA